MGEVAEPACEYNGVDVPIDKLGADQHAKRASEALLADIVGKARLLIVEQCSNVSWRYVVAEGNRIESESGISNIGDDVSLQRLKARGA